MADVSIVIDIEYFHRKIIKELGVACGTFSKSYSFKPPYPYDKCTTVEKKINSKITKSCHLIGWNGGEYEYKTRHVIAKVLTIPDVKYYAKGAEKCRILSKLFKIPFQNLDNLDCPPLQELVDEKDLFACDSFPKRHRRIAHCAHKKAVFYYEWLMDFEDLFTIL